MSSGAKTLCATCQCKTVEFVIAFSGPASCRSADVCRYDEAGYPWKIYCDKFRPHGPVAAVPSENVGVKPATETARGAYAR